MWLFLVHLLGSVDHVIASYAVTHFYEYETQTHKQMCAETYALVIGKRNNRNFKRNFVFPCTSRVFKWLDMAHTGLFITCVFPFIILCMRQTLVKITISIQVLVSGKWNCFLIFKPITPVKKNKLFLLTDQRHTKFQNFLHSFCKQSIHSII